jgi:hypothetical protein
MKFSATEFMDRIIRTDLSDEQIEQVVNILHESERVLDRGAPDAKVLRLLIDRQKTLFGENWRNAPPLEKATAVEKQPGSLAEKFARYKALLETKQPPSSGQAPMRGPKKPDFAP